MKHLTEDQIEIMRNAGIGLKEICEWWIEHYPEDIFIGMTPATKLTVDIRERMKELLEIGDK